MSLILDALRKADSERERGAVPGLHAHPIEALPADAPERPGTRTRQWVFVGVAAAIALVLAWFVTGREPTPVAVEPAASEPPAPIARSAAGSPAPAATSVPVTPDASPRSAAPAAPAASAASSASATASAAPRPRPLASLPVAEPAPWPAPERRKAPEPAAPATAPQGTADAPPRQGAPAAPPEPPIYAREQLPQHIQAELPKLNIGGSIYSPNAPDRSLIVNGRIFRERQQLTADLSLEQIRQKSAVLKYKGYRFEIVF